MNHAQGIRGAGFYTVRSFSPVHPLVAELAFAGLSCEVMNLRYVKGARGYAGFTAGTFRGNMNHYAIPAFGIGAVGTDSQALGIGTVITGHRKIKLAQPFAVRFVNLADRTIGEGGRETVIKLAGVNTGAAA